MMRFGTILSPVIAFVTVAASAAGIIGVVGGSNATELALRQAGLSSNTVLREQLDQETDLQAYAATVNPIFLQPYEAARTRFEASVARTRRQFVDLHDRTALQALSNEENIHRSWLKSIAAPLLQNPRQAGALALQLREKHLVDRFRDNNDRIIRALNMDATILERRQQRTIATLVAGGFALGTIFGTLAYFYESRRTRLERDSRRHQLLFEREREIADRLQRAVMDREGFVTEGASVCVYYQAASDIERVGGDWYDVFKLADGRLLIIIGDVTGHGLTAFVAMRDARLAILGAALDEKEPGLILTLANQRMLEKNQLHPVATALCAVLDPTSGHLRFASAGHPAPVLVHGSGAARLEHAGDLPLGIQRNDYDTHAFDLPPDARLVFHTDGLTDFAHDPIEGECRLMRSATSAFERSAGNPAQAIARAVLGGVAPMDDIAAVTVETTTIFASRCGSTGEERAPLATGDPQILFAQVLERRLHHFLSFA